MTAFIYGQVVYIDDVSPCYFQVVKRFIEEAEKPRNDGGSDFMLEFLQGGWTGKELLALLEVETKRKTAEVTLVFTALELLFSRYALAVSLSLSL